MNAVRFAVFATVGLIPISALADDAADCSKFKWSVAREQAAFAAPNLPSVGSGQSLPETGAMVSLRPQAEVTFVEPPARKPKVDPAYAAVLTLPPVAKAGTFQVTLSEEAWIDLLQDGKDIRSSGFSGQPDCAGVRKSVKFAMQPGAATVQISGASVQAIKVDILPAE